MAPFGCHLPHAGFFFSPALGTVSDPESWSGSGLLAFTEMRRRSFALTPQSAEQGISDLAGVGQSLGSRPAAHSHLLERLREDTGVSLSSSGKLKHLPLRETGQPQGESQPWTKLEASLG